MLLKSLELVGFKSFGKKSVLDFNTPVSAIVGPNGSGKSNVAEAFRFVLGEQSIKSMRGKKTEDLIFNGGGESGRANRASVKIIFDNSKRFLNVDFDEVTIERSVYRDSLTEYFINGSQVRLKDIIELLSGAHIGASGHHIISQGEADKILNANPKERREMIEDALGLKIYQYKRKESERKLEKTEENIKQVDALRKEIAPHLKFLKKQVEKVEKTLEMRETLKGLYGDYLKREDVYLKKQKAFLEESIKGPKEKLAKLENDLREAKSILEMSEKRDQKSADVIEIENKLSEVRSRKYDLSRDIGRLDGEMASLERMQKRQKELAEKDLNVTVPLKSVEELASEVDKNLKEAEAENDLGKARGIFGRIRALILDFISKNRGKDQSEMIRETESEIQKLGEERKKIEERLNDSKKDEENFVAEYSKLKDEIEKDKDLSRDAEKELFRIMSEENETRSEINSLKNKEEELKRLLELFQEELREGAALVGRDIFAYETFSPISVENGQNLNEEEIWKEERKFQEDRRKAVEKIKIRLEDAGGSGGDDIMKEFNEVSERDQFLERELGDLGKTADSLKSLIVELGEKLDTEFRNGIEKINKQFQEFFVLMFGGGKASLLVGKAQKKRKVSDEEALMSGLGDSEDSENAENQYVEENEKPEEEGVEIEVNLPRKKIKGLMMLSGGERTLTSIALIFAVSQVNPPPFIILDETDAALDEANSRKYGDMIENLSKFSQLILITHNRETMSRAGIIYGVTMGSEGVSKLLSIQFEEAVAVAK
ncbi:MAG: AAA family ATPase [Candidatus Paceibacterota bacterium]